MITWINEAKILIEHIPCDCKCKFMSVKSIVHAKKIIAGIIADVFMRIVAV